MRIVRYIWLIVTVLLLGCSRTGDGVALLTAKADRGLTVLADGQRPEPATGCINGRRSAAVPPVATLSDATQGYRLSTTRPQRVAPSQVAKSPRTLGKTGGSGQSRLACPQYSRFKTFGGWRCRMGSPFRPFVSRFYYIIALRRILC